MTKMPVTPEYEKWIDKYGLADLVAVPPMLFRYKRGEYLCMEGDALHYMLYVVEGKIKVSTTSKNGKTLLVCFYQAEGIIGSIEVLTDYPATATAQAATDVVCMAVAISPNRKLLQNSLPFLRYLNTVLSMMFARSSKNAALNLLYPLKTRVCSYIALAQIDGVFRENLTETSELLGASYRHLVRVLENLCAKGILEKEGRRCYRIADPSKLKAMAEDYYRMSAMDY
ncbi:MAG: cyclic nucleotide-binding domain-containing protein [Oscillospiraceae bacterium]|nr:cyclic nucleotide-binding domain-containing protein [Oscillospiraceae bacterium]